ncbi:TetR/AcrR family transcriptional regulator [Pseudoflavitalea sp. X16]|uniref:TetR/AcrR family transcriptional regulator n=1 Tax=Paraflavitalea devenefica TaxID=2716334 RepID=UPI00141F21BC|nr:TetR/AcrR family transcriptional regulator [Paraflavitalea devenefica]NII25175.1 TetR/AcrR family transcriptional regulator [Paraflavitalea devenefica]
MKFTPRSEETRRFIIETTAGIFNTKGYAGTSMSDLTAATQLTKGSIYGNFENKEEVALAVFDYTLERRDKIIAEQLSKAKTNKEKLLVFANLFCSTQKQPFIEGGCPLLNAGTEADDTFEPLRKKVARAITDMKKDLETIINDGIAAKEFRKDTNAEKTALTIMALVEGGLLLGKTTHKPAYLDMVLETVKDVVNNISAP